MMRREEAERRGVGAARGVLFAVPLAIAFWAVVALLIIFLNGGFR
jgi:hypothetical protein